MDYMEDENEGFIKDIIEELLANVLEQLRKRYAALERASSNIEVSEGMDFTDISDRTQMPNNYNQPDQLQNLEELELLTTDEVDELMNDVKLEQIDPEAIASIESAFYLSINNTDYLSPNLGEEAQRSTAEFDDFSSSDDEQWEGINANIANNIPKTDFQNVNNRNHWNRYNDSFMGPSTSQSRNVTPEAYDKYFMLLKNWLETASIDMNVGPPPFLPNVTMHDVISVAAAISAERRNADEEEQLQAMGAVAAVAASDGAAASSSYECRPAPIMRRIAAGVIDGIIVFMIKFYLIIILQDTFGLNLSSYADYLENPALFLNLSSDIAIMEFISKIFIFVYETYFISRHGATPGKRLTGLKVVTVDVVTPIPGRTTVKATALSFVTWKRALFRSILKNIGLFLFPILYGFLISNYTRAGYDHAVKTLVIDGTVRPTRIEEN